MEVLSATLAILSIAWIIKKLSNHLKHDKSRLPFPPGPKPMPLIGNMLDMPAVEAFKVYAEWGKRFDSPILHAEVLGSHFIIVNSREVAEQLLEQSERAKIYSDRPSVPLFPIIKWDYNLALQPYGDWWRQHRKICQQNFNAQVAQKYEPLQTRKVRQLLQGLLETPKEFDKHNKLFSTGLIAHMMYGYDLKSIDDPLVLLADDGVRLGARLFGPGGSLVNMIPALQHVPSWFPGTSSLKLDLISQTRQVTQDAMRTPVEVIKKNLEAGTAMSSLVSDFYEKKFAVGASSKEEEVVNNVAFTVYGASGETMSAIGTFFYTMAISPEVQKKAHAEIDRVVGSKCLPTLRDREAMPYVEAIYRECLRFNPPLPISVPHAVTQDDIYKGYFIPKGATILPNLWAMTHNEEVYPDPFTFKPERYLDQDGKLKSDDRIDAYGFGRRICAGRHVAEATMWLITASVLACFEITQAKDERGNLIEINRAYDNSGFVSYKEKFECDFRVRPGAQNLIMDTL